MRVTKHSQGSSVNHDISPALCHHFVINYYDVIYFIYTVMVIIGINNQPEPNLLKKEHGNIP